MAAVVPVSLVVGLAGAGGILLSSGRLHGRAWLARLLRWQDRQRQRAALLDLDARLLRDVGLNRDQAEREGHRHD